MAFGGAIKLTGESEYKKAIKDITNNLKVLSSEMKVVNSTYDKSDDSTEALTKRNEVLNSTLVQLKNKLDQAKTSYSKLSSEIKTQEQQHQELNQEYEKQKSILDGMKGSVLEGTKSYQDQSKKVDELSTQLKKSSTNIESNKNALTKMNIEMNNVQSEYNKTSKEIENNNTKIKQNENNVKDDKNAWNKLNNEIDDTESIAQKASNGFTVMKGALANLIGDGVRTAINGLKEFGTTMISVSAEVKAQNSKFAQTFGDMADEATKAIDRVAKSTGIIDTRLKDTASNIYAFARSSGASVPEAMELMETALMATADSAAYYDKSLEESAETLQSFLKGNFANDAALGVSATEFTRNAKAAELFGKKYNELSEIQKQKTLLKMVTDSQKLSGAMGQASRETDGFENVTGNLKETWKQFKAQVGTPFLEALIPILKKVTEGFKKWADSVDWQTFSRKVSKAIETIKNGFNWFIEHRNIFISAIGGMITAFAVGKILTFAEGIGKAIKVIGSAPSIIEGATAAMKALNLTALANPWVLLASAIAGVTAALVIFSQNSDPVINQMKEEAEAIKNQKDNILENKQAYEDLNKAKQETINQGFSEIDYYKSLYDELTTLVDENGKVKEGYEGRAKFISETLNGALGTELEMTNGVIKGYQNLTQSIQDLIDKKKAEIVLSSQEEAYKEAITNRMSALQQLNDLEDQYTQKSKERTELYTQFANKRNEDGSQMTSNQLMQTTERIGILSQEIEDTRVAKEAQEQIVAQYAYNVGQYEKNMALMHEGNYKDMTNIDYQYVADLQNAGDAKKAQLEKDIENEKEWLEILKSNRNETNQEIYDNQITNSQKTIAAKEEELRNYVSTIETGNQDAVDTWNIGLTEQLNAITGRKEEFKEGGKESGTYMLDGLLKGVENRDKRSGIFSSIASFGNSLLDRLRRSLDEHSPSKATNKMGRYLIEGLTNGIEDEEDSAMKQVSSFGENVIGNLQDELNRGTATIGNVQLSKSLNKSSKQISDPISDTANMINAFKTALGQMKVEMNDEEFGKFVDKTVADAVFN